MGLAIETCYDQTSARWSWRSRSTHPIAVVIEERIDEERRTNSLTVSSGYSGDGDDSLGKRL